MNERIGQALSFFDIDIQSIENLNSKSAYKLSDAANTHYFLKIYGKDNDYDIIPGERVYHTYEQLELESEILLLLSDSTTKTAMPFRNKNRELVTSLSPDADGVPVFAMITSFVDGLVSGQTDVPTVEMAYIAGESAARLHLESKKRLLPLAFKRLHKRQDYIRKIQRRLSHGLKIATLSAAQYEVISQCCELITDCMNRLDKDPENNVGLVHTDIRNTNIIYSKNHGTLIDFSRSVYSYYLYDLAEMCLHGDFGGSNHELQNAILRGYHSIKPLIKEDIFAIQTLFAMFLLTIMAESVESKGLENMAKGFTNEFYSKLAAGTAYLDSSAYENIF